MENVWPKSRPNDYCWESVSRAVSDYASLHGYEVIVSESSMWKYKKR